MGAGESLVSSRHALGAFGIPAFGSRGSASSGFLPRTPRRAAPRQRLPGPRSDRRAARSDEANAAIAFAKSLGLGEAPGLQVVLVEPEQVPDLVLHRDPHFARQLLAVRGEPQQIAAEEIDRPR